MCRFVVMCRSSDGLWRARTNCSRSKKIMGDERQQRNFIASEYPLEVSEDSVLTDVKKEWMK